MSSEHNPDSAARLTLVYRIDAEDRICAVSPSWRTFALENDGGEDLADGILETELWRGISDQAVCEIYQRLTARARAGRPVRFCYRCDAPALRRTFEMRIEAGPQGEVTFSSELVEAEPRPAVRLLDRASERTNESVLLCSWCQRLAIGPAEWAEVEEAVNRLGLLRSERLPALVHGICPGCMVKFRGLSEANGGD